MDSAESIQPIAEKSKRRHDVGVLFIHGIGQQSRGQTLKQCGEPIVDWLQTWFEGLRGTWETHLSPDVAQRWWAHCLTRPEFQDSPELTRDVLEEAVTLVNRARMTANGPMDSDALEHLREKSRLLGTQTVIAAVDTEDVMVGSQTSGVPSASATVKIRLAQTDGSVKEASWLMAESWWADLFDVPRFGSLAAWSINVIPLAFLTHFGGRVQRRREQIASQRKSYKAVGWVTVLLLWELFLFVLATPLGIVCLFAMLLLTVLALPPIPAVRSTLLRLQRRIASTIGDSYILLRNCVSTGAVISQVRRDIEWLSERSEHVAIVAHSQGAAIAHLALRQPTRKNLRLLLTFGSGLSKLERLKESFRPGNPSITTAWVVFASWGVVVYCLLQIVLGGRQGTLTLSVLAFSLLTFIGGLIKMARQDKPPLLKLRLEQIRNLKIRWRDFYAAADPVPDGAVFESTDKPDGKRYSSVIAENPGFADLAAEVDPGYVPTKTYNRLSTLTDHVSYWENAEQFVPEVIRELSSLTNVKLPLLLRRDEHVIRVASARRRIWVIVLLASRWIAFAAVAVCVWRYWREWTASWGWISRELNSLTSGFFGLIGAIPHRQFDEASAWEAPIYVLVVWAAYLFASFMWRFMLRLEQRRLYRRESFSSIRSRSSGTEDLLAMLFVMPVMGLILATIYWGQTVLDTEPITLEAATVTLLVGVPILTSILIQTLAKLGERQDVRAL